MKKFKAADKSKQENLKGIRDKLQIFNSEKDKDGFSRKTTESNKLTQERQPGVITAVDEEEQ